MRVHSSRCHCGLPSGRRNGHLIVLYGGWELAGLLLLLDGKLSLEDGLSLSLSLRLLLLLLLNLPSLLLRLMLLLKQLLLRLLLCLLNLLLGLLELLLL